MRRALPLLFIGLLTTASPLLAQDHSLSPWGLDYAGSTSHTPPDTDFAAVSCGRLWSVGLKTDGSLISWGVDSPSRTNTSTPDGNDFSAACTMFDDGLALKNDGTLVT